MKLLLCDDHAVFRAGLRGTLDSGDIEFIEATTAEECMALLEREDDVDAVLLDLSMPGSEPWEHLARLRAEHPSIPVIVVSGSEDAATVRTALDRGAAGFIPKSSPTPIYRAALDLVLQGGVYLPPQVLVAPTGRADGDSSDVRRHRRRDGASQLTGRQNDVAELLVKGLTNAEIAAVLGIAEGTVKTHMSAIFDALEVTNRTEAVLAIQEILGGD
jgi:DNA-binding NarL/FixJ family response regulator